jgi:crossover junction endodeoxyribonuclease RusA
MILTLPYPPSVNSMYRTFRGRMLISKKGREWMKAAVHDAKTQANGWCVAGPVSVWVKLWMPDNRRRDIDNAGGKAVLDCITHAGIWKDDCQVHELRVTRAGVSKSDPHCDVTIEAL